MCDATIMYYGRFYSARGDRTQGLFTTFNTRIRTSVYEHTPTGRGNAGKDGRGLLWFTPCRLSSRPNIGEDIENGLHFLVEHWLTAKHA